MKITDINELQQIATEIRKLILEEVYYAQSGHPGGSLSCTEILTALYFNELNVDEKKPIAQFACKLRDESFEPNYTMI